MHMRGLIEIFGWSFFWVSTRHYFSLSFYATLFVKVEARNHEATNPWYRASQYATRKKVGSSS